MNQQSSQVPPYDDAVELLYDATKELLERQIKDYDARDLKTVQVMTIASVVIGLTGIGRASFTPSDTVRIALMAAVAAYLVVAGLTLIQLYPRTLSDSPAPEIRPIYWNSPANEVRRRLITAIIDSIHDNEPVLQHKIMFTIGTLLALSVEVTAVGVAVIASLEH